MRCPKCDVENPDGSAFCQDCGTRFDSPTPPSDEERARQFLEQAFRLSEEGKLAEAIVACKRALSVKRDSTSAYSLLGILYERAGQREQAIEAYETALRLSPESVADRESLQQLVSPPTPPVEAARPPEAPAPATIPAAPAAPPPVPAAPRTHVVLWSLAAVCAAVLAVLAVMTWRNWGTAPVQEQRAATAAPAPEYPAPEPVAPEPQVPLTAGVPGAPGFAPTAPEALPARVEPPERLPEPEETPTAEITAAPSPVVTVTIPTPEAFIVRGTVPAAEAVSEPAPADSAAGIEPTPTAARVRFFDGDIKGALDIYERVTSDDGQASPEVYQEMGWLYYKENRPADAATAYRQSLRRYYQQFEAGEDAEAARHGIRTAEAALKVLETE
ncbi:MAG: tetratricopeptide repeat protein [Armatimonadota bacterium]|nr:MAG: tetratricopeptide repeat protein [Armatimonadota bacterium]